MTAATTDAPDLSFLSIVKDGADDFVVGNGETFVNLPEIAVSVIEMMDGTKTIGEVREAVLQTKGADVDVLAFITDLDALGLLNEASGPPNLWDRVRPSRVRWLFSLPANTAIVLLFVAAVIVVARRPDLAPIHYSAIVRPDSSLGFVLIFAVASWTLLFTHELSHILAARSLGVRAKLSLGTRQQFLVAQTRVTGIWRLPKHRRYRVHLAGMRTDLAACSAGVCALVFVHNTGLAALIRMVALICLWQVVWQFLFFMRTDVYYAYANLTGNKNLMADAKSHLRSLLRRRNDSVPLSVRGYAWFLIAGQIIGIAYFAGFTIPVTITVCNTAFTELSRSSVLGKASALMALIIIAATWGMFAFLVLRRFLDQRKTRLGARDEIVRSAA